MVDVYKLRPYITKLEAAQRQLRAAIRMYFYGEDELAIHTVASAAYRLLADLKINQGKDEVADYHLTQIFYAVRSYRRGDLPDYLKGDAETMKWIQEISDQLPINAESRFEDFAASVSPDTVKLFWKKRNKTANFLKHADRDVNGKMAVGEIDNLSLLIQALASHVDLVGDNLGVEGLVFWLYLNVTTGYQCDELPSQFQAIAEKLYNLGSSEKLNFCSKLLRDINKSNGSIWA